MWWSCVRITKATEQSHSVKGNSTKCQGNVCQCLNLKNLIKSSFYSLFWTLAKWDTKFVSFYYVCKHPVSTVCASRTSFALILCNKASMHIHQDGHFHHSVCSVLLRLLGDREVQVKLESTQLFNFFTLMCYYSCCFILSADIEVITKVLLKQSFC